MYYSTIMNNENTKLFHIFQVKTEKFFQVLILYTKQFYRITANFKTALSPL